MFIIIFCHYYCLAAETGFLPVLQANMNQLWKSKPWHNQSQWSVSLTSDYLFCKLALRVTWGRLKSIWHVLTGQFDGQFVILTVVRVRWFLLNHKHLSLSSNPLYRFRLRNKIKLIKTIFVSDSTDLITSNSGLFKNKTFSNLLGRCENIRGKMRIKAGNQKDRK